MKKTITIFIKSIVLNTLLLSSTLATTGISSLSVLKPLFFIVLIIPIVVFVVLPIWMVFHAKKLSNKETLSKGKLKFLVFPIVGLGIIGLFFGVSSLLQMTSVIGYGDISNWSYLISLLLMFLMNSAYIYFGWSTYTKLVKLIP